MAEVRLNALGLALYRLWDSADGSVAVSEACQLVAAGWAELRLIRVRDIAGQPHVFECAELTSKGMKQTTQMMEALEPLEADWGDRTHITGVMRVLTSGNNPPPPLMVEKLRVFSSETVRRWTRDRVAYYAAMSAQGWCAQASGSSGIAHVDLPSDAERRQFFEQQRAQEKG